jgi:hypothetical protein
VVKPVALSWSLIILTIHKTHIKKTGNQKRCNDEQPKICEVCGLTLRVFPIFSKLIKSSVLGDHLMRTSEKIFLILVWIILVQGH